METLEIVIGMVFVYLLLSLLATILQELWASLTSLRGKVLLKAIAKLLEVENMSKVTGETKERLMSNFKRQIINSQVYQKYSDKILWVKQLPSYLSAEQVTGIIKELLEKNVTPEVPATADADVTPPVGERGGLTFEPAATAAFAAQPALLANMQQEDLKKELSIIFRSGPIIPVPGERSITAGEPDQTAESVVDKAKAAFKQQYDEIMDRATGWYKRGIQMNLIVIGLLIAFAFNGDTFQIYGNLTSNPDARQQLLLLAENFSENKGIAIYTPDSIATIQLAADTTKPAELRKLLDSILINEIQKVPSPVGLGWDDESRYLIFGYQNKALSQAAATQIATEATWWSFIQKILGWVVTALAISLGAPFWFDLLKKLINIRNADNRPQTAAEQVQK